MIQLTRCNATPERLPQLCDWLVQVARLGVTRARVHILEIDHPLVRAKYSLSEADNVKAFREVFKAGRLCGIQFVESEEPEQLLMMNDEESTCIWRACDPFTTEAVYGIDGTGNRHNCGLTDKEGINFQRPSSQGFERYIALYHTPYEFGGCKGCRFFLACKGQCPGTGIDGDWRNRSENCGVWMALFDDAEKKLVERGETPISIHPQRHEIEMAMLAKWRAGMNPTLSALATELPQMSGCAARQQAE
jgi:uncharacterized protein